MKNRLAVVGLLAVFGVYQWHNRAQHSTPEVVAEAAPSPAPAAMPTQMPMGRDEHDTFHCDGRTRCQEMTSCAEARFFLRNCPGVKMDGDNDGLPCEDRCGHL